MSNYRSRALSVTQLVGSVLVATLYLSGAKGADVIERVGDQAKVSSLLKQMTLNEKLSLIQGVPEPDATDQGQAGYLAGIERLGIPPIRMADGPPGVLTRMPSAAETATMGLAATFSREDARKNGQIIADEAIRLGIDVVLEPFINIYRDIAFSRGYNTYGEDPMLSGAIGAELITGIQSRGVMAQAKHYIGYDTGGADVEIDDQALHEIYLAPFADAIKAGVSSIMCSYNKINGAYACGNKSTLIDVLRGEMGFEGFVTSDWGAVHDFDYLPKGLDMEMPGIAHPEGPFAGMMYPYFSNSPPPHSVIPMDYDVLRTVFEGSIPEEPAKRPINWAIEFPQDKNPRNMWDALYTGVATEAMIDQAAGRVLLQMAHFGYLDGRHADYFKSSSGLDIPTVIRQTSEDAAVLLKNDGDVLPLSAKRSGSIALIGPGALQVVAIGISGERSVGQPERQVGPYAALRKVMPEADIRLSVANDMTGVPVPSGALSHDGRPGLLHSVSGKPVGIDPVIDFTSGRGNALPAHSEHVWQGRLTVSAAGEYRLYVQTLGARGTLFIDGKRIAGSTSMKGALHGNTVQAGQDNLLPTTDGLDNVRAAVSLSSGAHDVKVTASDDTSGALVQVRLNWITPEKQRADHDAAIAAAREAKTAVVFLWQRRSPTYSLPGEQDRLVEEIAAVNPNTIVVLNTSKPFAMPWLNKVKAVVQMWWPGDEGGWATANILAGKKNPAGRLPFTWAKALVEYAAEDPAHSERSAHSSDGKTVFSEGVNVGYRWFDKKGTAPLFPFGYGLSYTRFAYSGLHVMKTKDGGIDVGLSVKNVGRVAGEDVPQIYVSPPKNAPADAQFAVQALAGFDRVSLQPGESKTIMIHVERRRLQYWSTARKGWMDASIGRTVSAGGSSRDLRLQTLIK